MKIHDFWLYEICPRVAGQCSPGGAGGAREVVVSARAGAAGVPEYKTKSGMLLVVSLPICTTIGGP